MTRLWSIPHWGVPLWLQRHAPRLARRLPHGLRWRHGSLWIFSQCLLIW